MAIQLVAYERRDSADRMEFDNAVLASCRAGRRKDGIGPKRRRAMPTYEFSCEKCESSFAVTISISEYEKRKYRCPKCGGKKVKQLPSSFEAVTSKKS